MSIGKDISHEQSIKENLAVYTLEVGSSFEAMSIEAAQFLDRYTTVKQVVDLGCGDGAAFNEFTRLGYKVTGVDINPEKLKQIKGYTVCNDFITYLKHLKSDSVENIFSHHALEHYPFYEQVLAEIARVLKPGGYSLIICPYEGGFRGTHHAVYSDPEHLLPPGFEPIITERKTRQEPEVWALGRK